MKTIIVLFTILTIYSCDFEREIPKDPIKLEVSIDENGHYGILGEWVISVHKANGVNGKCNVCARITFTDSGSAILYKPSGDIETYRWVVSMDTLTLEFIGHKETSSYLPSSKYAIEFSEKAKFTEMTLSLPKNEEYILRK